MLVRRQVCFVHGYRYARLCRRSDEPVQRPRLGPYQIEVLDFSPNATFSFRERDHTNGPVYELEDGTRQTLVSRLSILNNPFLFRKTIMSSLPYVVTTTGKKYLTEGVMIGDSSLIISRVSYVGVSVPAFSKLIRGFSGQAEGYGDGQIRQTLTVLAM